jgi:L-asparaginase
MKSKNKKICIIFAGGTMLSEKDPLAVNQAGDINGWLKKMPEIEIMAEIEPIFLIGEGYQASGKEFWQKINNLIQSRYDDFMGFIVINRVSDILFNALAASFAFNHLNKPIIFTGSQLPVVDKSLIDVKRKSFGGLGIKANLINAVQIATMDFPVVGLMFGNAFLRATKAVRSAIYSLNIFTSADNKYLAKIDFGISPQIKLSRPEKNPEFINDFEDKVLYVKYQPGLTFEDYKETAGKVKGLVIESLPVEPFSEEFKNELNRIKIPVVVYNKYYVPDLAINNVITVRQMTKETALIKFMWALGQTDDVKKIREIMNQEYAGEFINN